MKPFFSIIIPVYNGISNDLPICLESIWKQNMSPDLYEVICIDDCSTDDTRSYMQQEQEKHPNLKVRFNTENLRQGGGKNVGIRAAAGEYILFIDQDDYYHSNVFNACHETLLKQPVEVLVCDSAWQQKGKESNVLQLNYPCTDILDGRNFIRKNGFALAPWRMICHGDYLLKNQLFFREKVRIEDIDWGCRLVMLAKKIKYQPVLLVHYNRYEAQTTSLMKSSFDILRDQMFAAWRIYQFAKTVEDPYPPLESLWKHHYRVAIRMMLGCYAPVKIKSKCIQTYCSECAHADPMINRLYQHPALYAFLSNCAIPFYRLAMTLLTKIRWMLKNSK